MKVVPKNHELEKPRDFSDGMVLPLVPSSGQT